MKIIPVLYLLFYCAVNSYSQKDTVYFNTDGKVIIKEFASFYRVCDYDTSTKLPDGKFTDYDAASQKKIAEGYYSDSCRDGLFRIYDINENPWSEFHYSKNELTGNAYYFYPSGDTMCILMPGGNPLKILQCKDSASNNLIFDGVGEFRKEYNSIVIEGKVENYLMDGTWTMKYPEGKFIEKYKNGAFKSGKQKGSSYGYFNPKIPIYIAETQHFDKTELLEISNFYRKRDYPKLHNIFEPRWEPHQQDKGFIIVEDKGGFPGGNEYLAYYIQSRVYYP